MLQFLSDWLFLVAYGAVAALVAIANIRPFLVLCYKERNNKVAPGYNKLRPILEYLSVIIILQLAAIIYITLWPVPWLANPDFFNDMKWPLTKSEFRTLSKYLIIFSPVLSLGLLWLIE